MWSSHALTLLAFSCCCIAFVKPLFGCKTIFKCCGKGEWLDFYEDLCKKIPGTKVESVSEEQFDISQIQTEEINLWYHHRFTTSSSVKCVRILYKAGYLHDWNINLNADVTNWQRSNDTAAILIKTENDFVVGHAHCFDAFVNGDPYKRVLKTVFKGVRKCCKKGTFFNDKYAMCLPWKEYKKELNQGLEFEVTYVHPNDSNTDYQWVPNILRDKRIEIMYEYGWFDVNFIVAVEEHNPWVLEESREKAPIFVTSVNLPWGETMEIRSIFFCFETIKSTTFEQQVIMANIADYRTIQKCCPVLQSLNSYGTCEYPDTGNISYLQPRTKIDNEIVVSSAFGLEYCTNFVIVGELSKNVSLETYSKEIKWFSAKTFCSDVHRSKNGEEHNVLAYCLMPPSGSLYRNVRPLQVLAIVFLVTGVAIILCREDSRRNMHNVALAIHASCLVVSNSLQMIWFVTHAQTFEVCEYFIYSIYFFMMAAACWLNAVAVNMAHGFSRPLGALARGGSGGWGRLAVLSAYAWGVPAALTALAVLMDLNKSSLQEKGYITPSFSETRTCRMETEYSKNLDSLAQRATQELGSFLYYFLPSALLVVANSVCVIFTMCKIRSLREDSSLLQSDHPLRSTLLYVKLLLGSGVLEMAVEVIAWVVRRSLFARYASWTGPNYYIDFHLIDTIFVFAIVLTFVEVARAGIVLWLCVGRWRRVVAAWRWLRGRLPWERGRVVPASTPVRHRITSQEICHRKAEQTRL